MDIFEGFIQLDSFRLANKQFTVQRYKTFIATGVQGQHLLSHHMPSAGMIEMARYARHLLAKTLLHRIIDHIGFFAGRLQGLNRLVRDLFMIRWLLMTHRTEVLQCATSAFFA